MHHAPPVESWSQRTPPSERLLPSQSTTGPHPIAHATARIDVPPASQNKIQNLPEMVQRPGKVGSKPEHAFEVTAIPNPPLSLPQADPPLPPRFITRTSRCVVLPTIGVSSGNAATKGAPLRGGVARSSPARPLHLIQTKGVKTRE